MSIDFNKIVEKLPSFDSVFKILTLVAIGYLIFNLLSIFNVTSKKIDDIKENQKKLEESAQTLIVNHNKAAKTADSLDNVHIQQIKTLNDKIFGLETQLKSVQNDIRNYKQVFDKNKVDLPNPWQNQ